MCVYIYTYIYTYMHAWCMYIHHMHALLEEARKGKSYPLEWELRLVLRH